MRKFLTIVCAASLLASAGIARAVPTQVDLELCLLVDVSGSVSSTEFNLQKTGYVNAFNDASLVAAIEAGPLGQIGVTMVYWSGGNQQSVVVPWTLVSDAASATGFANLVAATTQVYQGVTGLGEALVFGANLFPNSPFDSALQVIDISGDGADNDGGTSSSQGRNYALANGVETINGLVILGESGLLNHYTTQVIGGANAFVLTAATFADFEAAISAKLIEEVQQVIPEPITMIGLVLGVGGLAGYVRKRRAA